MCATGAMHILYIFVAINKGCANVHKCVHVLARTPSRSRPCSNTRQEFILTSMWASSRCWEWQLSSWKLLAHAKTRRTWNILYTRGLHVVCSCMSRTHKHYKTDTKKRVGTERGKSELRNKETDRFHRLARAAARYLLSRQAPTSNQTRHGVPRSLDRNIIKKSRSRSVMSHFFKSWYKATFTFYK